MATKDQADIAAESLLSQQAAQSRRWWFRPAVPAPARKWTPLGLAIGLGVGVLIGVLVNGSVMPGMGFGMFFGAVLGACFDKQIRPRFLIAVACLLALVGAVLWYLARVLS